MPDFSDEKNAKDFTLEEIVPEESDSSSSDTEEDEEEEVGVEGEGEEEGELKEAIDVEKIQVKAGQAKKNDIVMYKVNNTRFSLGEKPPRTENQLFFINITLLYRDKK